MSQSEGCDCDNCNFRSRNHAAIYKINQLLEEVQRTYWRAVPRLRQEFLEGVQGLANYMKDHRNDTPDPEYVARFVGRKETDFGMPGCRNKDNESCPAVVPLQ